ncbi:cytochrome c oxidase subunit 3 [Nafulsella turpanensis]|uniref:cytochrome c oxidase subunit 3 n=1 Tax=Nafulsella turpanensis TaxID=1265690 RepID=UPI00034C0F27|nr:cytochrome c oxidase subunit 3 [Nafulsella turpanensis]
MNTQNINIVQAEQPQLPLSMSPKKFILWLFIVSIVMLFAAWTSAYIVAQAEGVGVPIELPSLFGYTSILLILSSISMHLAYRAAKRDQLNLLRIFSTITFILGVGFLAGQLLGFEQLVASNVYFVGGTAIDSFTFVLPFMHGVHIVAGLVFLLIVLVQSFRYKVHSKSMLSIELCATFWHFLDGLWLYLFLFLTFN